MIKIIQISTIQIHATIIKIIITTAMKINNKYNVKIISDVCPFNKI